MIGRPLWGERNSQLSTQPFSVRYFIATLTFIGAAVLFLPLFVFLPKLIQTAMRADVYSVIETFGKNEQVKRVFWAVFVAVAGVVLTKILDPVAAQGIISAITGTGL